MKQFACSYKAALDRAQARALNTGLTSQSFPQYITVFSLLYVTTSAYY